jgi:hypothetical protein
MQPVPKLTSSTNVGGLDCMYPVERLTGSIYSTNKMLHIQRITPVVFEKH